MGELIFWTVSWVRISDRLIAMNNSQTQTQLKKRIESDRKAEEASHIQIQFSKTNCLSLPLSDTTAEKRLWIYAPWVNTEIGALHKIPEECQTPGQGPSFEQARNLRANRYSSSVHENR